MSASLLFVFALSALGQSLSFPGPGMIASTGGSGGGSPTLVAHTAAHGGGPAPSTITTSAVNTTGATLIMLGCSIAYGTLTTPTDSASNTWSMIAQVRGNAAYWYTLSPSTSSTHTFSCYNDSGYDGSMSVLAFSGVSRYDTYNSAWLFTPGSITPAQNGELIITVMSSFFGTGSPWTVTSGFTVQDAIYHDGGPTVSMGVAWQVQTMAAPINPTWSGVTGAGYPNTSFQAAFK